MKTIKNLRFVSGLVSIGKRSGMTTPKALVVTIGMAAVVIALVRATFATPSSGIVSSAVWARASFLDPVDLKFKIDEGNQHVIHVPDAQETVIQQIIIGPGGSTGWHTHPGPAVVLIKSGELTVYSSDDPTCTGRTYSAGQAFIEHGQGLVQLAGNLSPSQNVEVWVTYFDVPPGGPFRLDAANPGNCGP